MADSSKADIHIRIANPTFHTAVLFYTSFFMSLMFPNIFALGLKRFEVMAVIKGIRRPFETAVQRVMAGRLMRICQ